MKILSKAKSYIFSPTKCFIPKCKAVCCTNAPLPEDFLPKFESKIQRDIYYAVNIGVNDMRDTFNSVIYNTTRNPIQLIGRDAEGHSIATIPPELLKELNIKSMDDVNELMKSYNQYSNYCPFITDYGRCSVYEHRPQICRDFGSTALKIDRCADKSSRFDIAKFFVKQFFDFKSTFIAMKENLKEKFFVKHSTK